MLLRENLLHSLYTIPLHTFSRLGTTMCFRWEDSGACCWPGGRGILVAFTASLQVGLQVGGSAWACIYLLPVLMGGCIAWYI
jgi:hypothetical protein